MKRVCILGLALLFSLSCSRQTISNKQLQTEDPKPTLPPQEPEPTTDKNESDRGEKSKNVPAAFRGIDFANLSYPTNWRRKKVHLKNGTYQHPEGSGGDTFELLSVDFADVTDDGKKEAVVQLLWVSCGVSCDGGSHLFYFYSAHEKQLSLVSRIETGSLAYECGLKSFALEKRVLTLEVFRMCHVKGPIIQLAYGSESGAKFIAENFTRFVFVFRNGRVKPKHRQVLPYPPDDLRSYNSTISIRD